MEGSSMKSKRFLITAIILISATVALTPSIAKADVYVYDNDNQYLGILLELKAGHLNLFMPSLGASWYIEYDEIGYCYNTAYFDSADCSGTPYLRSDEPLPEAIDLSNSPIGGFYKSDYNGKRTFTPGSYYESNCQCQIGPQLSDEYIPLTQVQMPFTTPVALPLKFKVRTKTVVVPLSE
jgi:hypothetical protein